MMSGMQEGRKTEAYQGDAALAGLLKEQRSFIDLESLKAMIPGVAAAPSGDRADDWIDLVAPEASEAVKSGVNDRASPNESAVCATATSHTGVSTPKVV